MAEGQVLVVDDDPTMVKLVKLTLEGVGFRVHGALNGAEALQLLTKHRDEIGVAVIDYQLPGSRLEDLLRDVRSQSRQLRCIVTSGYLLDMLEGFGGSLPLGVEFLKKPFLPKDLIAAVQRAFTMASGIGG